jgi:hypothetical protein
VSTKKVRKTARTRRGFGWVAGWAAAHYEQVLADGGRVHGISAPQMKDIDAALDWLRQEALPHVKR